MFSSKEPCGIAAIITSVLQVELSLEVKQLLEDLDTERDCLRLLAATTTLSLCPFLAHHG